MIKSNKVDAPSGEAEIAGTEGLAHHNVIWNIGQDGFGGIGMMIIVDKRYQMQIKELIPEVFKIGEIVTK